MSFLIYRIRSLNSGLKYLLPGLLIALLSVGAFISVGTQVQAEEVSKPGQPYKLYKVEGAFADVKFDLENAIVNAGLKIIYRGNIKVMLERTADSVGVKKKAFENAEFFLFCSAPISHGILGADPRNIAYCPFNLYFYSLPGEEDVSYVGYRRPDIIGSDKSKDALKALDGFLDGILKDVVE